VLGNDALKLSTALRSLDDLIKLLLFAPHSFLRYTQPIIVKIGGTL
jgi:hypothetical protein